MDYLPYAAGGVAVVGGVMIASATLSSRATKDTADADPSLQNEDIANALYTRVAQPEGVGVGIWEGWSPYCVGAALAVRQYC